MDITKIKIKVDCFAFEYGKCKPSCRLLRYLVCANEDCGFYKSRRQYEKDLEKYPHKYEVEKKAKVESKGGNANGE